MELSMGEQKNNNEKDLAKMENDLKQLEILMEQKDDKSSVSLWSPSLDIKEALALDDSYNENIEQQLRELKFVIQEYINFTQEAKKPLDVQVNSADTSSVALQQQYIGLLLKKVSDQGKAFTTLQESITSLNDSLRQVVTSQDNFRQDNDKQKELLESICQKVQDTSTKALQERLADSLTELLKNIQESTQGIHNVLEQLQVEKDELNDRLKEIQKNTVSLDKIENTHEQLKKSMEQSLEEIKGVQVRMDQIENAVKEVSEVSKNINATMTEHNQTEQVDVKRYQVYKGVFHELSKLMYDDWTQHAEKYRLLDNGKFSNSERMSLSSDLNKKLDINIDVMNYFIELTFHVKKIMSSVQEGGLLYE